MSAASEHQAAYRARRDDRYRRMETALEAIMLKVQGDDRRYLPMAIRELAKEGLRK